MLLYLLKFSACLAIFMIFYKVLLQRCSIHKFKRFYLLGALAFALLIPSLTFTEYIEANVAKEYSSFTMHNIEIIENAPEIAAVDYTPIILWSIYAIGALVLLLKFCFNLNKIITKIRSNPKLKSNGFINVLVSNLTIPYTFFNYIFFNKHKFELNEIPKEVLLHEQTHAKQKHSIDVLLLELLQIIFWFNPLLCLLKREVKLNHEFLADYAVLQNGIQPSKYQTILLAFSSKAQHQELANAINYSSIKKRFTVMNTNTSKQSIWLRSLLLLPMLAILFYGFAQHKKVEKNILKTEVIELYLNENKILLYEDKIITLEDIEKLHKENPKLQVSIKIFPDANPEILKNLRFQLKEIGIKKIKICTSTVAEFQKQEQQKVTEKEIAEYNKLAKYYNKQSKTKHIVNRKEIERLEHIYNIMSDLQKHSAQPFPNFPLPPTPPKILIKKRMLWVLLNSKGQFLVNDELSSLISVEAEFKNIATHKNKSKNIVFKHEDNAPKNIVNKVNKLINQYNLKNISDTLPLPPAAPKTKTGFKKINNIPHYYVSIDNNTKYYNRKGFEVNKKGITISKSQINASDVIPDQYITKIHSNGQVVAEFNDNKPNSKSTIVNIPPPPITNSKSTLDFVIDLAKKNAKFFFDNKEISSDKAIALLKQNPDLNVLAKDTKKAQPLVYISIEPIRI